MNTTLPQSLIEHATRVASICDDVCRADALDDLAAAHDVLDYVHIIVNYSPARRDELDDQFNATLLRVAIVNLQHDLDLTSLDFDTIINRCIA